MRAITWVKERGAEFAEVSLGGSWLRAAGVAVSADPLPYHLSYELECADDFVTRSLTVQTRGANWSRHLALSRDPRGTWKVEASAEGEADGLPPPGGDSAALATALDCDLGECPVTNTMPVLRHGLLHGGAPRDFIMAWVSVPDLAVRPSAQRYTFVSRLAAASGMPAAAVIRYESGTFRADVVFDGDGLVIDYPGLGRRA